MSARKTVIYARASLTGRRGDVLIERQVEACRRFAHECDLAVAEVISDQGASHGPRPGLEGLLDRVRAGEVETVVVRSLDALSPAMLDSVDLVAKLGQDGARVRTVEKAGWMLELLEQEPESL